VIQVFEHRHQVPQVAPEAIQPPTHQDIKASALGILQQFIESGSLVLCTADARIDVFHRLPPTSLTIAAKLQ